MGVVDVGSGIAPEEDDRGNALPCGCADLGEEDLPVVVGVGVGILGDDDVDPEREGGQRASPRDLCSERVRLHAACAKHAEAACVRDGRCQLRARPGSEADREDSEPVSRAGRTPAFAARSLYCPIIRASADRCELCYLVAHANANTTATQAANISATQIVVAKPTSTAASIAT
jgi:hypothetical protein